MRTLTQTLRTNYHYEPSKSDQEKNDYDQTVADKTPVGANQAITAKLEVTVSNPHYGHDLKTLDGSWDLTKVLGPETILIVTGCSLMAELLDRPVAEMLRDEIDRRGTPSSYRRGIVIGDIWWSREMNLHSCPVISIGSSAANTLTDEIAASGDRWEINGLCGAFLHEQAPRVALWGELAVETRASVEHYIQHPDGLAEFLKICWE